MGCVKTCPVISERTPPMKTLLMTGALAVAIFAAGAANAAPTATVPPTCSKSITDGCMERTMPAAMHHPHKLAKHHHEKQAAARRAKAHHKA